MVDMIRRSGRFRRNRIHHVGRVSRVHRVCHFHHVCPSVRNIQGEYNRGILLHLSFKISRKYVSDIRQVLLNVYFIFSMFIFLMFYFVCFATTQSERGRKHPKPTLIDHIVCKKK